MNHIKKTNSAEAFLRKFVIKGNTDDFLTNTELYDLYVDFCHENDKTAYSKQKILGYIREKFPNSKRGRTYIGNERPHVIFGIKSTQQI